MLSLNASAFYRAATLLSMMAVIIENWTDNEATSKADMVKGQHRETFHGWLEDLEPELKVLGCRVSLMVVGRLLDSLSSSPSDLSYEQAARGFTEIRSRLKDELSLTTVFVMPAENAKFYLAGAQAFGPTVAERLPMATPDIEAAGKCLGLSQGTASVFHLMRAMEAGLKELAKMLGIPYAPSWESYITQITTKIAAKHKTKGVQWKRDEPFYRDLAGDLQTVKIAWRNPTMHIVRHYSVEEAEEIYRAVRGFLQHLAGRLPKSALEKMLA